MSLIGIDPDDRPTASDLGVVTPCRCYVDRIDGFQPCERCEAMSDADEADVPADVLDAAHDEAHAVPDEITDLFAGWAEAWHDMDAGW